MCRAPILPGPDFGWGVVLQDNARREVGCARTHRDCMSHFSRQRCSRLFLAVKQMPECPKSKMKSPGCAHTWKECRSVDKSTVSHLVHLAAGSFSTLFVFRFHFRHSTLNAQLFGLDTRRRQAPVHRCSARPIHANRAPLQGSTPPLSCLSSRTLNMENMY